MVFKNSCWLPSMCVLSFCGQTYTHTYAHTHKDLRGCFVLKGVIKKQTFQGALLVLIHLQLKRIFHIKSTEQKGTWVLKVREHCEQTYLESSKMADVTKENLAGLLPLLQWP